MTVVRSERTRGLWARRIAPTTRWGRVACRLALAFVAWLVLNQALVVAFLGERSVEGASRVGLILLSWAGLGTGLAAGVVALLAMVRRRERGALVFAAMLPALAVLALLVGELLAPH